MAQVVQAAAGADEFTVPGDGLRLGREGAHFAAGIAVGSCAATAPIQRRAVERALVLAVFGAGEASAEVAPQRLVAVPVHAHVETTLAVDVAVGGGVVAVHRVVGVGIEPPEDVLRVGVPEAVEQLRDFAFARVGLGRHQIASLDLALEVEGQAAFEQEAVVEALVAGQRLDRTAGIAVGYRQVGDGDREHVAAGHVDVERVFDGRAVAPGQGQVERVLADRHQVFGRKLALQVHRMRLAVDLERVTLGDVAAMDADA